VFGVVAVVLGFGVEEEMSPAFLRRSRVWSCRGDIFNYIASVVGLGIGEGFADARLCDFVDVELYRIGNLHRFRIICRI
jgi:hypothetical protein